MLGLLVDWYPKATGRWHAGLSAGVGGVVVSNLADKSDFAGANLAGGLFAGYDFPLAREWALGLQLTANGATPAKLQEDRNGAATGYRLTPLSIGLQASLLYF
jgi:hypothetical protein